MRDAIAHRLGRLAETNPRLVLLTGDLGFGVLTDFAKRFPKQYLNVGVAEQNLLGIAVGLALEGRICVVYSIANFPTLRCLEQVRNDACYHNANVKIVAIGGGFSYGALGMSHHATEDIAILRALPGMKVISPADKWEAAEAIENLIGVEGPAYLRVDKSSADVRPATGETFRLGKLRRIRDGDDISLLATGGILGCALQAADLLHRRGVECRVYSVHTIKPLDHEEIARAAEETCGLVTIEEHGLEGGLGGAIAESCVDQGLRPHAFLRLGLPSEFAPVVGSQDYLRKLHGLDAESIAGKVGEMVRRQATRTRAGKSRRNIR